jgi:hypothetical protein
VRTTTTRRVRTSDSPSEGEDDVEHEDDSKDGRHGHQARHGELCSSSCLRRRAQIRSHAPLQCQSSGSRSAPRTPSDTMIKITGLSTRNARTVTPPAAQRVNDEPGAARRAAPEARLTSVSISVRSMMTTKDSRRTLRTGKAKGRQRRPTAGAPAGTHGWKKSVLPTHVHCKYRSTQ